MPASRVRVSKPAARRPSQRFAKRRQQVIAFEAWQRHAADCTIDRQRISLIAKR
jgi:hypothetical protein